jgi:hypothetical protein
MPIIIVQDSVPLDDVKKLALEWYGSMIKGVVDIEREIIALGGEFHMDANQVLMDDGSAQSDVWGFNLEFSEPRERWIVYRSLINIRPALGNRSMFVIDPRLQEKMRDIIEKRISSL